MMKYILPALFLACVMGIAAIILWPAHYRVAAAAFEPPGISTDPSCKLSTKQMVDAWVAMYPESRFETMVVGSDAQQALDAYNKLPPRSGVIGDRIYVYSHPKAKGVHGFVDKAGCVTAMAFLPRDLYLMLIGKAK